MSKNPSKATLRALAKKYFIKEEDTALLEDLLRSGEIYIAQVFLLGFIDRTLGKNKISMVEAYEDYDKLGLSPEEAIAVMDEAEEYLRTRRTKH